MGSTSELIDPRAEFGLIVKAAYGTTTRNLEAQGSRWIRDGKAEPCKDLADDHAAMTMRGYFKHVGLVYNWNESFPVITVSAAMLTVLHEGSRTDVRKVSRVNKGASYDRDGNVVDPIGGPTTIPEYHAAVARIDRAAGRSLRKPKTPPGRGAPGINADLLLWVDYLTFRRGAEIGGSPTSYAAFGRAHGTPPRTAQYRLTTARQRLVAEDPRLAPRLIEPARGRPKTRKVAGVRGEGADRAPAPPAYSCSADGHRLRCPSCGNPVDHRSPAVIALIRFLNGLDAA